MEPDTLTLEYVPLSEAVRWDENPKRHSIRDLVRSIETHGFGDPPKYDAKLGALVYGNGRTEALEVMRHEGKDPPRGVGVLDDGEWAVPVIFGVDAESKEAAVAFAVDHNNLTLLGGNLSPEDILQIWDEGALADVLGGLPEAAENLISFDASDLDSLLEGPSFDPVSEGEQSRLDEKKLAVCPECGAEFLP